LAGYNVITDGMTADVMASDQNRTHTNTHTDIQTEMQAHM